MKSIPIISILVLFSCICQAQKRTFTLEECVQYALENSPRKNIQEAQNEIYNQNYKEAIGALLPYIGASTNVYMNFGRGVDSETNTYTDINAFSNNYNLSSSVVLFNGLANINKVKMQKASQLLGKQQLDEVKDAITYELIEGYFNVLFYKEAVTLAEQQLKESQENLKLAKRMEELGMKSSADVAELYAKEASDQYNLTQQTNLEKISYIQLKEKMHYPVNQDLDIEASHKTELIGKTDESAREIYEKAVMLLPKAKVAESNLAIQKIAYQASKGSLYPTVTLNGGISTNFSRYMDGSEYVPFRDQFKNKRGYYVGIEISIPIFSGFSRTTNINRSKQQYIIAQNQKEQIYHELYSEVGQVVSDMNGQADAYYHAKKQTQAMDLAHQVNEQKYKEGLISAIELHTSSNRLLQAKMEELNAQFKFYLKQYLVDYFKGGLFFP